MPTQAADMEITLESDLPNIKYFDLSSAFSSPLPSLSTTAPDLHLPKGCFCPPSHLHFTFVHAII
ncbi:hypothetical protein E2C01_014023 [Portunus trituberculatus]|uniref:Uncharacterized protein n=1 Tax=Portunus trituberculatus TaxID=210409 RepID=A0A5B7DI38_PORTR|nr:hypothetical protein [Portunus trituberculatus]